MLFYIALQRGFLPLFVPFVLCQFSVKVEHALRDGEDSEIGMSVELAKANEVVAAPTFPHEFEKSLSEQICQRTRAEGHSSAGADGIKGG